MLSPCRLLSVIIPVYNEKSTIAEVIEKVISVDLPIKKEIIVVDDGSTDGTVEILQNTQNSFTNIHLAPVNAGKGAAIRIGLTLVTGDIILIQDADLELDPNEYARLIKPIMDGETSVVYGSRFLKKTSVAFSRRIANYGLTFLTNLLYRTKLTDMETAYKMFTKEVAQDLRLQANRFDIEPEITAQIACCGYTIREIPISYRPRTKFEGKKIKIKDGFMAVWTLLKYRLVKFRSEPPG